MRYIFLLTCLWPLALYSQSFHIREIKFRPAPKYYNTKDTTIIYPVIATGDPAVDRSINKMIREQVLDRDSKAPAREILRSMIRTGLTDMDYEVTYRNNGILSLRIDVQVMAAYPNSWSRYLNFDLRTGRYLQTRDIIQETMFDQFKSKIFADKADSLKSYKEKGLKSRLMSREMDSSTYRSIIEMIDSDCINSVDVDHFSLSDTGIEIIDPCDFPHVIKGWQPDFGLRYSYGFINSYLRSEFQSRLRPYKNPAQ